MPLALQTESRFRPRTARQKFGQLWLASGSLSRSIRSVARVDRPITRAASSFHEDPTDGRGGSLVAASRF
jgi:hypothetical protein